MYIIHISKNVNEAISRRAHAQTHSNLSDDNSLSLGSTGQRVELGLELATTTKKTTKLTTTHRSDEIDMMSILLQPSVQEKIKFVRQS